MLCVGKDTSIGQHISNTQTTWQLAAGDEKSISALLINILWDMADKNPYLVPILFQEAILAISCPKILALLKNPCSSVAIVHKNLARALEGCTN
jgi:hypothetical protein